MIEGCEGEGCGCTKETKTSQDFVLHEKMDSNSKVLGKFKSGTEARAGKSYTKIIDAGSSKILEVSNSALDLKVGDTVTTVFNLGEGIFKAKSNEKWIEFEYDQVKLKQLSPAKYQSWLELKVGKLHGYTPNFPFFGCLE